MGKHFTGAFALAARLIAGGRALGLAAIVTAAAVGGAAAQDNKTIVVKLATATLNDAQHEWLKRFAVAIEKNTNGRMKGEVYPASQLGAIPRMIEGTQLGSIQIWVGPPEFLVGVDQRFELLSVPGLFKDDQHSLKTVADADFAKAFLALGANKGLIGASLFWTGPYAFAMRAPMRTLADIKGKKIRVLASPFQMEQMTRLGATGVPLTLGDVLPALQQGTLDGALGALPVFSALQYQGSAKYMTETGHAYIFSTAMVSKKWFDGRGAGASHPVGARLSRGPAQGLGRQGRRGHPAVGRRARRADAEDAAGGRRHRQDQARSQAAVGSAARRRQQGEVTGTLSALPLPASQVGPARPAHN
jgi:TRAP-type C4-dicarboxylate transport system substrate-binding protein